MSEEKPKSIWKKSLTGWKGLGLRFIVFFAAAFVLFLSAGLVGLTQKITFPRLIKFALLRGLICAIAATLLIAFLCWIVHWRNFKKFLFGLACFITLIALFYAEEDWRGKHDWNKFKREWEAKGERFDWQSIVPPTVPDDQNFAFSPVWIAEIRQGFWGTSEKSKSWYGDQIYSEEVSNFLSLLPISTSTVVGTNMWNSPQPPDNSGAWMSGKFLDLKPFQSFYRDLGKTNPLAKIIIAPQPQTPAQDVLLALSKFDPVIEQLRQDSARPYSRFPIQYNNGMPAAILLPHLAAEKRFSEVLQLRAVAELQNGESKKALADVKLMLRLVNASRSESFLVSHLVRLAILNLTLQPIWEGLAGHKWSDTQLAELDSELAGLNFLADYQAAVRGERNLEIANIEFIRHPRGELHFKHSRLYSLMPFLSVIQMLSDLSGGEEMPTGQLAILGFGPSGWFDQNELRLARFDTKWYLPVVDEDTKTISPAKMCAANAALKQETRHRTPENVLETLFIPNWNNAAEKFAHAQNSTDLARVALALERYRLAHGNYPESLDALTPKVISEIPHDIINGEPLKYRREANGQFILYSVGWNETDDGGTIVLKKGSTPDVDINKDDWVWKYPENNPKFFR